MSTHPLIFQLRLTRSEFVRCLEGVSDEDACRHLGPMNCISWTKRVGYGQPPSTPPLDEMWSVWHTITRAADKFLDTLTTEKLQDYLTWQSKPLRESIGALLYRNSNCSAYAQRGFATLGSGHAEPGF
jgi:hypothetical protein